jgi:hypothetical protein
LIDGLEDLGNGQVLAHRKRREDVAYMLSEGNAMAAKVKPSEVLHCISPSLRNRTSTMSTGISNADLWIAKNGDPTASVDSALRLAKLLGNTTGFQVRSDSNHVKVKLSYKDGDGIGASETLPLAIILALFNYTDKLEDLDL